MSGDEIFGYGWREDHARAGDRALANASGLINALNGDTPPIEAGIMAMANVQALAAIAQAHYAAANIRTRPIRDAELPVTDLDWMTRERSG